MGTVVNKFHGRVVFMDFGEQGLLLYHPSSSARVEALAVMATRGTCRNI